MVNAWMETVKNVRDQMPKGTSLKEILQKAKLVYRKPAGLVKNVVKKVKKVVKKAVKKVANSTRKRKRSKRKSSKRKSKKRKSKKRKSKKRKSGKK